VYGGQLRLSNLAVLLAFAVGAELFGILGALLALPVAAMYPCVEDVWLRDYLGRDAVEGAVDREGKFVVREGEVVFAFGRQKGKPLREVARVQRDYLEWILRSDFPDDARKLVEAALRGE